MAIGSLRFTIFAKKLFMNRKILTFPLIYAIITTFASCSEKNFENSGAVWGTSYRIVYSAHDDLGDSIVAVMKQVEDELSMFEPSSTVSRVNRGEDPTVGKMFADVFQISKEISEASGGAFDPTIGPLTNLWGFGYKHVDDSVVPSQAAIDSALITVGMADCHIVDGKVIKKHPQTVFDFSSVAKGYGVDAVAAMLRRNGSSNYLVEIGGEISAKGVNPKGQTWRIQIDAPVSGDYGHQRMYVMCLDDAAVATSGNYRNYRETAGGRIGHTIDPHSGLPVATATASATVIAPDCATADALATACMVIDAQKAITLIESTEGVEALLAVAQNDTIVTLRTSNFPDTLN